MFASGSLTLLNRSLQAEARSRLHLWIRLGSILVLLLCVYIAEASWAGAPGAELLDGLAITNLLLITVLSATLFATAITEEREEGTLPLLRMTRLSAATIIFGKGLSRALTATEHLILQVPFAFLAIMLGGTSVERVVATYEALFVYLVLMVGIGLFFSVYCQRSGIAAAATLISAAVLFFGPFLIDGVLQALGLWSNPSLEWLTSLGYFTPFGLIEQAQSLTPTLAATMMCYFAIGTLLVLASCAMLSRSSQFDVARSGTRRKHSASPHGRPGANALAWKDFHFVVKGYRFLIAKVGLYALAVLIFALPEWDSVGTFAAILMFIAYVGLYIEISIAGEGIVGSELRGETLPSLCMLPKDEKFIFLAKLRGCLLTSIPAAALGLLGLFLFVPELKYLRFLEPGIGAIFLCMALLLPLHGIFTAWLSFRVRWGSSLIAASLEFICIFVSGFLADSSSSVTGLGVILSILMVFLFMKFLFLILRDLKAAAGS